MVQYTVMVLGLTIPRFLPEIERGVVGYMKGRLSRKRRVQCSNNKRQFDPDFKVLVWLQRKDKEKG